MRRLCFMVCLAGFCLFAACKKSGAGAGATSRVDSTAGSSSDSSAVYTSVQPLPGAPAFSKDPYQLFGGVVNGKAVYQVDYQTVLNNTIGYLDSIYVYDIAGKTWSASGTPNVQLNCGVAQAGSKIFFGGGTNWVNYQMVNIPVVNIYDAATGLWTQANLSQAREQAAGASNGNTLAFAGGFTTAFSSAVDLYDVSSGTWSTGQLSVARNALAAAGAGSKLVFAGGFNTTNGFSDVVDIYDTKTKLWSTAKLSIPRGYATATAVGSKILIAGGLNKASYVDTVDIYDTNTGTWSTTKISSQPRMKMAATSNGNMAFFAGGVLESGNPSNLVDVYNSTTGVWGTTTLAGAASAITCGADGDKVLFAFSDLNNPQIQFLQLGK